MITPSLWQFMVDMLDYMIVQGDCTYDGTILPFAITSVEVTPGINNLACKSAV